VFAEKESLFLCSHIFINSGELVSLPFATSVCSEPLLDEFQGTLILVDLQQFNGTFFIWCKTTDFLDNITDKLYTFAKNPFSSANFGLWGILGDFVPLVKAN